MICAGHICIDITPVFPSGNSKMLSELLMPGKLINMEQADVHTGGSVANTGLAMKFLGADVSLMGKVGDDAFGVMIKDILEKYGAADGLVKSGDTSTSYTIIIAPHGIDRIFLHNSGANDSFAANDISVESLNQTALFHFGYPPLMKKMYQNDGEQLIKLFQKAKECGASTSLDLALVDPTSEAGMVDWKSILTKVLPYVDFFVPSAEELCFMLDKKRYEEWENRAQDLEITTILDIEKDIKPLANQCMALGAKVLLIKCGARGLFYKTSPIENLKEISTSLSLNVEDWANHEGFERSYTPNKVISATGAGDTTIAAFLTAMLNDYPLEDCIHLASATGASCVEAYDALSGLKTFEELNRKIKSGWKKQ